jgi:hypothetical protein
MSVADVEHAVKKEDLRFIDVTGRSSKMGGFRPNTCLPFEKASRFMIM